MKKLVKKWGNSLVTVWNKEDQLFHNIKDGSVLDLIQMKVLPPKRVKS